MSGGHDQMAVERVVPPRLPHTWRPVRARAVSIPVAVVTCGGGWTLAFAMPGTWGVADRVGLALVAAALTGVLLMLARPVARADDDGLTVVNLLRRRRLGWTQVLRIGLGRDDPWAMLDLSNGETLPVMALQASDGERARRGVAELAALVAARGEARHD